MKLTNEKQAALRAPFPPEKIGSKPRGGVRLDFVGHADVTDRLLEVDPEWTWEPVGVDALGLPAITKDGLWIRLTVCGVTRYGFGDAEDKTGPAAIKEMIGDAIRNAAMRYGVALDLWSKADSAPKPSKPSSAPKPPKPSDTEWIVDLKKRAEAAETRDELRRIFLEITDGSKHGKCNTSEAIDLQQFVNTLAAALPEAVQGVIA